MEGTGLRLFAAACLAATGFTALRAAEPADVKVEVFNAASAKKIDPGIYPRNELSDSNEGWVVLNFMIDPAGRPYEISVEKSLGGKPFERTAIQSLERSTFQPATLNGQPVHSASAVKYKFAIQDLQKGAKPEFVSRYRRLIEKIQKGDRASADALLSKLIATNLYEDANRNVALFYYSLQWGTESEQITHIEAALAGESTDKYLERKTFVHITTALLSLNLKRGYLAEALSAWEMLRRMALAKDVEKWKPVMSEVQKIVDSGAPLKVRGEIDAGASWFHTLLREKFEIVALSGKVSEIKLRCEKGYVFFRFDPTVKYTVNRRDGRCRMELVGDPGTRFQLIEG